MKTKREMRQEAIKRLNETEPFANGFNCYKYGIEGALVGVFADIEVEDVRKCIIDLLSDDDDDMSDYIKLPKDANGEPWHVGDVTENGNVVMGMAIDNTGEWYFINTRNDIDPHAHYHHHKSTVEDMLQKMLEKAVGFSDAHTTVAINAIFECAAKLQLKEDE